MGIHTGLVVVGEIGGAGRQEQLALGRRPISRPGCRGWRNPIPSSLVTGPPAWWRAILPASPWERRNSKPGTALQVYRVLHASAAQTRLDVAATRGLTPLVGRASKWRCCKALGPGVKDGMGHVVVLSGEAGIGKSRLVQVLKEYVAGEAHTRWECRCSP